MTTWSDFGRRSGPRAAEPATGLWFRRDANDDARAARRRYLPFMFIWLEHPEFFRGRLRVLREVATEDNVPATRARRLGANLFAALTYPNKERITKCRAAVLGRS